MIYKIMKILKKFNNGVMLWKDCILKME